MLGIVLLSLAGVTADLCKVFTHTHTHSTGLSIDLGVPSTQASNWQYAIQSVTDSVDGDGSTVNKKIATINFIPTQLSHDKRQIHQLALRLNNCVEPAVVVALGFIWLSDPILFSRLG